MGEDLFGPLSNADRISIDNNVVPDIILNGEKTNPPACPLRSQKGTACEVQTPVSPVTDTAARSETSVLAGPGDESLGPSGEAQADYGDETEPGNDSQWTELLPHPLESNKGPVARSRLEFDYWQDAAKEEQEDLVKKSLTLLIEHIHHKDLSKKWSRRVYHKTPFNERLKLAEISDPQLLLALKQAQSNIMHWLTIGAASHRVNYTANNYANLIHKKLGFLSMDESEITGVVLDCAYGTLWCWKSGSVFGLLNRYLHSRIYTRLSNEVRYSGKTDDVSVTGWDGRKGSSDKAFMVGDENPGYTTGA